METKIRTRVVAIANQKGGVGKTTTVVNLAAALAKMRRTVLVIDLDPQANATTGLGLQPQEGISLYPCLIGQQQIADMIQPTPYENLNVIPSEVNLSGSEIDLAQRPDRLQVVRNVLQAIRDANVFDYILLDCPPSLGILMTATLAAADGILVPMQAEYYALEGLSVMQNLIARLKANGANPALELNGILMTMVNANTRLSQDVIAEVREHFADKVFETMIPRNVRTSEAPSYGQPVVFYDPSCRGAEAYRAFAREFAKRNPTRGDIPAPAPVPTPEAVPAAADETGGGAAEPAPEEGSVPAAESAPAVESAAAEVAESAETKSENAPAAPSGN